MGDFLTKPTQEGGLNTVGSSIILLMILCSICLEFNEATEKWCINSYPSFCYVGNQDGAATMS